MADFQNNSRQKSHDFKNVFNPKITHTRHAGGGAAAGNRKIMNRLISLQIIDSVYRLTMRSTVLSYADKSEAVDSETDDRQVISNHLIN